MAKDPAFLFYPGDWLGGTMGMSFEEKGAYIELLILQFNRGRMTKDMIGHAVGQLWHKIKDKFVKDNKGLYYNTRLEQEKTKRQTYTNSRRNNILGKNQHTKKEKENDGHTTSRMENENEIKNRIEKFVNKVILINNENKILDSIDVLNTNGTSFVEYWVEHGEKDRKVRFEKQTSFDIKRRLLTWKNNKHKYNKKDGKINSYYDKYPDLFNEDGTPKTAG